MHAVLCCARFGQGSGAAEDLAASAGIGDVCSNLTVVSIICVLVRPKPGERNKSS